MLIIIIKIVNYNGRRYTSEINVTETVMNFAYILFFMETRSKSNRMQLPRLFKGEIDAWRERKETVAT